MKTADDNVTVKVKDTPPASLPCQPQIHSERAGLPSEFKQTSRDGSSWLMAISFCVCLIICVCSTSIGSSLIPSCLPEKKAKRIEHTASSEKRFQLYVNIAEDQISRLRRCLRRYRPWREMPPVSGFPPHVSWQDVAPERFLGTADCAWDEMMKELAAWKPREKDWEIKVRQMHYTVTQAHQALQDAEVLASPLPSLQSRIHISLSKIDDVEMELLEILNRTTP